MNYLEKFKHRFGHGGILSNMWHNYAPNIVLGRKFYDTTVYMDLADNIDDLTKTKYILENREKPVLDLPKFIDGLIWDVGANVGLFSICSDIAKRECIAFEISPKACALMEKTKQKNKLSFRVVNNALSVHSQYYTPPQTSSAENKFIPAPSGSKLSLSYIEAERIYGTPALIKMDIEGGEKDFFNSKSFKRWIIEKNIVWAVETHSSVIGYFPKWNDVPHIRLFNNIILYSSSEEKLTAYSSR